MAISDRNKMLALSGQGVKSIVLVDFDDYANQAEYDPTLAHLSPTPPKSISIGVGSSTVDYYNNFVADIGSIAQEVDLKGGGFGKTGNITLKLNNTENIIKSVRNFTFENTNVTIRVLLHIGTGTPRIDNSEVVYKGIVSKVTWDENTVTIQLVDNLAVNDPTLLTKQITKKEYPNCDDNVDGKYIPFVGGRFTVNLNPTGLERYLLPNCTTPAYLVDKATNTYKFADHTIRQIYTPSVTQKESHDSSILRTSDINNSPWQLYGVEYTGGESPQFTCSIPNTQMTLWLNPTSIAKSDNYGGIITDVTDDDLKYLFDDNGYLETGLNCKTSYLFQWSPINPLTPLVPHPNQNIPIKPKVFFKFQNPDAELQPGHIETDANKNTVAHPQAQIKMFTKIKEQPTSQYSYFMFMIRSNGNNYYHYHLINNTDEGFNVNYWNNEYRKTPYALLNGGSLADYWDIEAYKYYRPLAYIHKSINVLLDLNNISGKEFAGDIKGWASKVMYLNSDNVNWKERLGVNEWTKLGMLFPTSNTPNLSWTDRMECDESDYGFKKIKHITEPLNDTNILGNDVENWEFGILASNNVAIEHFGLLISGVYFDGGYIDKFKIPVFYKKIEGRLMTGGTVPSGFEAALTPPENKTAEEYDKWWKNKQEIDERSNVGPVHVMVDGYNHVSYDNVPDLNQTAIRPQSHMCWMMNRAGVDWNHSNLQHLYSVRDYSPVASYNSSWEFHHFIDDPSTTISAVLKDMAFQCGCFMWFDTIAEEYRLRTNDWLFDIDQYITDYGVVAQFDQTEMEDVKFTQEKEVYDSFTFEYAYSSATKKFERTLNIFPTEEATNYYDEGDDEFEYVDEGNYNVEDHLGNTPATYYKSQTLINMCKDAHNNYHQESDNEVNLRTLNIKCDKIQNVQTARRFAIGVVKKYTKSRPILKFKTKKKGFIPQLGDVIYCGRSDWATKDCTYYQVRKIVKNPVTLKCEIEALQIGNG